MKLKNFLIAFGILAILLTVIPLFTANYWWIRVFDYPHVQLTILTFTAFVCYFMRFDLRNYKDYLFAFAVGICLAFQFYKIYPYTPLSSNQVNTISKFEETKNLKVFVANVLQTNKKKNLVLSEIKAFQPDVVVLLETDENWAKAVVSIEDKYPYSVKKPLSNTYGMLLYSKKELIDPQVHFLVADSIPSISTKLRLNPNDIIQLYVIHPTPPMPQHNPKSTDRDGEMMLIGKMAKDNELPTVVLGDFNDVAWSETTKEFQQLSQLLDPRIGRGFYTTYNANSFLMRWPLDHIFVSKEFLIEKIDKGKNINSDHFPIFASIVLERNNDNEDIKDLNKEERNRINRTIEKSQKKGN